MAVGTPVLAYVATITAGIGIGQSANFTFTVSLTGGWYNVCPIKVLYTTNVSAGPQISVYRSQDNGVGYDTIPLSPLSLPRQSGGSAQVSLKLETGRYAVAVLSGGGSASTWTIQVLTQMVMTGILNV